MLSSYLVAVRATVTMHQS